MTFSEKRVSKRIRNMLVVAKSHATLKGIDARRMVVGMANLFYHFPSRPDMPVYIKLKLG